MFVDCGFLEQTENAPVQTGNVVSKVSSREFDPLQDKSSELHLSKDVNTSNTVNTDIPEKPQSAPIATPVATPPITANAMNQNPQQYQRPPTTGIKLYFSLKKQVATFFFQHFPIKFPIHNNNTLFLVLGKLMKLLL